MCEEIKLFEKGMSKLKREELILSYVPALLKPGTHAIVNTISF